MKPINFKIDYTMTYPSGKGWREVREIKATSKNEALSLFKWLKSDSYHLIKINSVLENQ